MVKEIGRMTHSKSLNPSHHQARQLPARRDRSN
jgi:hypothetical protein